MGYFPFFVDLTGREGLIAGGGTVALRKVEKLLPYGPRLTVVAPEIVPELESCPELTLLRQPFAHELLENKAFVIAATDDKAVNHEISALCRERGIPVNVVDDPEVCTFLFPALVKRGDLSVGISTAGASPTAAVWLKQQVEALVPERMEEILDYLSEVRPAVKTAVPEERRGAAFARVFRTCMEQGRPLTGAELEDLLEVEA